MAIKLTSRDALVVLLIGSSNSAGNTDTTTGPLTRPLPATVPQGCFMWDRWLDPNTANRVNAGVSGYGWEPVPSAVNLNLTDVGPVYSLAEQYSDYFYSSRNGLNRRLSRENMAGRPKAVYFIQYSASSSRATQDASTVNPGASWYPKALNTAANTAYETFMNLYVSEALAALEAPEAGIDKIYLDCVYVVGNESAGYADTTSFAFANTTAELVPGMSMLHSEMARQLDLSREDLVEVTVSPSASFEKFVTADTSQIPAVRQAYADYAAATGHPLSVVDGTQFDVYTRSDDVVAATTVAAGNLVDYDDTGDELTITQASPSRLLDVKFGVGESVEFDILTGATGAVTGTGVVVSVTPTAIVLGSINQTSGTALDGAGDVVASPLTGAGSVTGPAATDTQLNHYTGQGVMQLGESCFLARRAMGTAPAILLDLEGDGRTDIEDI